MDWPHVESRNIDPALTVKCNFTDSSTICIHFYDNIEHYLFWVSFFLDLDRRLSFFLYLRFFFLCVPSFVLPNNPLYLSFTSSMQKCSWTILCPLLFVNLIWHDFPCLRRSSNAPAFNRGYLRIPCFSVTNVIRLQQRCRLIFQVENHKKAVIESITESSALCHDQNNNRHFRIHNNQRSCDQCETSRRVTWWTGKWHDEQGNDMM